MTRERWKDIPGYEGFYKVSNLGKVKTLPRIDKRGAQVKERILKHGYTVGYPCVVLSRHGIHRTVQNHRVVLLAFKGPPPRDFQAAHLNGVRDDARLSNLKWKSRKDNEKDKILHGTDNRGSKHVFAKLTDRKVLEIRFLRERGWKMLKLALKYKVSSTLISHIVNRKQWAHI